MSDIILEVKSCTKRFGGLLAVDNVSLTAKRGIITGLIGPNGAGKTTLFNAITGFGPATSGNVYFEGEDVTKLSPTKLVYKGLSRTFQIVHLFNRMTVLENVMAGFYPVTKTSTLAAVFSRPIVKREEQQVKEQAIDIIRDVGLEDIINSMAGTLSTGQQRLLEIARAMASTPKMLMLDEPAAGLNNSETDMLADLVRRYKKRGVSVFMIEHNMKFMMGLADYIYVLNFGELLAEGSPHDVTANDDVTMAYLGKGYTADA